ncbi:MAG: GH25 family lysozyme [Mesorhizobium sp.]
MRRIEALVLAFALGACSTGGALDDFAPTSRDMPTSSVSGPRFGDSNPYEWRGTKPWNYPVHGTDVSKYQPMVDWPTKRVNKINFVFIKATEGGDRVDDRFHEHRAGARAAGIPYGAYHFFYFCRPASEQAAWFIQNVPREKGMMPPVLDMEWNHLSPSCKLRPPPETVRAEMRVFLGIVERHYGKRPIIYTDPKFFEENGLEAFRGYPFWLRSTAGHPSEKYGPHPFVFWQYTGTGIVPGIRGDADINVFNGSPAAWRSWLAANRL